MADLNEKLNQVNNTKDITDEFDPQDINENKGITILAYLGWLLLIPLLVKKDSKFARFHCNQGLVLAIVATIVAVLCSILGAIPIVGIIFGIIGGLIGLVWLIFAILGIMNVVNGRAKELPFIGNIHILK